MVPFEPERLPDLSGTSALIIGGSADPIVPRAQTERLAEMLGEASANVTVAWQTTGHGLTQGDVAAATRWLAKLMGGNAGAHAGGTAARDGEPGR
jgi:predicted esterase